MLRCLVVILLSSLAVSYSAKPTCFVPIGGKILHANFAPFGDKTWKEIDLDMSWGEHLLKPYKNGRNPDADLVLVKKDGSPYGYKNYILYFPDAYDNKTGCVKQTVELQTQNETPKDGATLLHIDYRNEDDRINFLGQFFIGSFSGQSSFIQGSYAECVAKGYDLTSGDKKNAVGIAWMPDTRQCLYWDVQTGGSLKAVVAEVSTSYRAIAFNPPEYFDGSPAERNLYGKDYASLGECGSDVRENVKGAYKVSLQKDYGYCTYSTNSTAQIFPGGNWRTFNVKPTDPYVTNVSFLHCENVS